MENIRNFAIVAHIDHGKSTLADRIMEVCGAIKTTGHEEQLLDSHPVSRQRGITIRLSPVTMTYTLNSQLYTLNLIDTPGHVDFSYEVERSLAACEGVILLVDATQGVQAQTLSHYHRAKKLGLDIIPVINKIDMPNAMIEETLDELAQLIELDKSAIMQISAKTGNGVEELIKEIILKISAPKTVDSSTRALVFSSQYDPARGVTAYVRIFDGQIETKSRLKFIATNLEANAFEIGHFSPAMIAAKTLSAGEVGYIITNAKDPSMIKIGDTITVNCEPSTVNPLPGYQEPRPVVFVSIFPVDQNDYYLLEDALKKLKLNDAAIEFLPTSSKALGRGFRCGFLGHLHAEVSQERLERDFELSIISTSPTVEYPEEKEPWVVATIITPQLYLGPIIQMCEERRGKTVDVKYHGNNVNLIYELPLAEIITDFFDQLKSKSSGYASIDYEAIEYREFESVQLDILINHEPIDAMSQIMEKSRARIFGKKIVEKLKEAIPKAQFAFPIQASINGEIVARADVSAFRKDVTAKLYGGDRTRKDKLLEAQKKGKKKLKTIGRVELPGDIFLKVFKT